MAYENHSPWREDKTYSNAGKNGGNGGKNGILVAVSVMKTDRKHPKEGVPAMKRTDDSGERPGDAGFQGQKRGY